MPMAGRGGRYANSGERVPKPLIKVAGAPMFSWALRSLAGLSLSRLIVVVLEEHEIQYRVSEQIQRFAPSTTVIVRIPEITEGQLCTVLAARDHFQMNSDLLITSSDTYVKSAIKHHIDEMHEESRGLISVADLPGEQWSFAKTDPGGRVVEVAEKKRISRHASTGLYYFSNTAEFLREAEQLIAARERTLGEYFVIPLYQRYIERGWRVEISRAEEMWDLGTPQAKQISEKHLRQLDNDPV